MSKALFTSKLKHINHSHKIQGLNSTLHYYPNIALSPNYTFKNREFIFDKDLNNSSPQFFGILFKKHIKKQEVLAIMKIIPTIINDTSVTVTNKKKERKEVNYNSNNKAHSNSIVSNYLTKDYDKFYELDNNILSLMHSKGSITKCYWNNIFFNKSYYELISVSAEKSILKGEMVAMEDYYLYEKTKNKIQFWSNVFTMGLPIGDYEREVYRSYIHEKMEKRQEQLSKIMLNMKIKNPEDPELLNTTETKIIMKDLLDYNYWVNMKTKALKKYKTLSLSSYHNRCDYDPKFLENIYKYENINYIRSMSNQENEDSIKTNKKKKKNAGIIANNKNDKNKEIENSNNINITSSTNDTCTTEKKEERSNKIDTNFKSANSNKDNIDNDAIIKDDDFSYQKNILQQAFNEFEIVPISSNLSKKKEIKEINQNNINNTDLNCDLEKYLKNSYYQTATFCNSSYFPYKINLEEIINSLIQRDKSFSKFENIFRGEKDKSLDFNKLEMLNRNINYQINAVINSEAFYQEFDFKMDFELYHSVNSFYVWLVSVRLFNFAKSAFSNSLRKHFLADQKRLVKANFNTIDTLRRLSKIGRMNEESNTLLDLLTEHFYINEMSKNNNYYKIDSFVWTYILKGRVHRYDDIVYKLGYLIVNEFQRMSHIQLKDIKEGKLGFDLGLYNIPLNYKEIVLKHNQHVFNEIKDYDEENNNRFKLKKYHYNYRQEAEKEDIVYIKTYINTMNFKNKHKMQNDLMSNRPVDEEYDFLKDNSNESGLSDTVLENFEVSSNNKDSAGSGLSSNIESNSKILNKLPAAFQTAFKYWIKALQNKYLKNIIYEEKEREIERIQEINKMNNSKDKSKLNISNECKNDENSSNADSEILEENSERANLSKHLKFEVQTNLKNYLYYLENDTKNACKNEFIQRETNIFYPEAGVITSKVKKTMVEKLFKIKHH